MDTPEKSIEATNGADLTLNPSDEQKSVEVAKEETAAVETEPAENNGDAATEAEEKVKEETAKPAPASAEEVAAELRILAEAAPDTVSREEISRLRHLFMVFRKADDDKARQQFIENGGNEADFAPEATALDAEVATLIETIKERKNALMAEQEAQRKKNFEAKEALIEEINSMSAEADNVNRQFPRFREIQQEFKAIGDVPPQNATEQWKKYQDAVEHFYDQLKINKDLRDYDFKKNLDTKLHLCDEAEALTSEPDIIVAFKRLQDLHAKWRETGPVAKEFREEIWNRFKDASAAVNKKYQAYFEERKAKEAENEQAKTAICEQVEAIDLDSLKSFNAWNDATKVILTAQEDWKKLGFASRKANNALFARFRAVCDRFFELKADYYKSVKNEMAENLRRKNALADEAEQLKESTDWKATAERLSAMQKEWRTIGAVPKKNSDAVWQRFQSACDYFFEQRKKNLSDSRHTEQSNLKAKKALIAALRETSDDATREQVQEAIRDAQAKWNEIGHVPFREKDKVYEEFRAAINELYAKHNVREQRSGMARFENSLSEMESDAGKLRRERERLSRVLEGKRSELTTYNNNLGFLSVKSSSGSSLLRDIERRSQRIKDDITDLENKIRLIDEKL